MPLYSYSCTSCENSWSKLVPKNDRDRQSCDFCGSEARRLMNEKFSVSSKQDPRVHVAVTEKEIDKVVGSDAESKWVDHEERVSKRREGKDIKIVELGKPEGGKFNPQEIMGSSKQKELGKQNSEAFRRYQKEKAG
jgi:putative FmdB family regulatory protein